MPIFNGCPTKLAFFSACVARGQKFINHTVLFWTSVRRMDIKIGSLNSSTFPFNDLQKQNLVFQETVFDSIRPRQKGSNAVEYRFVINRIGPENPLINGIRGLTIT